MDITMVVEAFISLLFAVITCVVIPCIRSKKTLAQQDIIFEWVCIAVTAAEQLYNSTQGKEKKQYVIDCLSKHNLKIDADKLDTMIESAVYQLKHF